PSPAKPNEAPTARPVATVAESSVVETVIEPVEVSAPPTWVVVEPPAVAPTTVTPAAAPRPPVIDSPFAFARSTTVVVIETFPVAVTLVPAPGPVVTIGESSTVSTPAANPATSPTEPSVNVP